MVYLKMCSFLRILYVHVFMLHVITNCEVLHTLVSNNNSNPFNGLLSSTTHVWAPLHPD